MEQPLDTVHLHVNGQLHEVRGVSPTTTLLEYLRGLAALAGTKEGCAEGDCGACTVVVVDAEAPGGPRFRAVNSCLLLLPLLHGTHIYTVEALREPAARGDAGYHPVQQALVDELGSQCGYCTPGVVMSMFEACYRDDLDAPWKVDDQMCGNLCRCTGYRPIREATLQIAGRRPDDRFSAALREYPVQPKPGLRYQEGGQRFWVPRSWPELFEITAAHPEHRFVMGATDLGLDVTKKGERFEALVSLHAMPQLRELRHAEGRWVIGATVRLADLEDATDHALPPIARMLRFFGSRQIKNSATVGGNLCNASPIGDLAPVLLALGADVVVRGPTGERTVPIDEFFVGYRRTAMAPGELLCRVELSDPPASARIGAYKVSKRREMDISAVAAGLRVDVHEGVVQSARFGFGGMAATPARAHHAEAAIVGQPWSSASCELAAQALAADFTPMSDHRGSAWFRTTVAANLIRGLFDDTARDPMPRLADRPSGTVLGHGLATSTNPPTGPVP
ncbi:MAG: xanthine dehydrogenase small subunit [Deltaproteobacteria bacterium]|nr:xanthine dehydrogenase small subunit [Deltaproteobacteria bacterium]